MILTGFHAIEEYCRTGKRGIIYYSKENARIKKVTAGTAGKAITVKKVSGKELQELSQGAETRGIILKTEEPFLPPVSLGLFLQQLHGEESLVVILDSVTDPHNLGAVLRSAAQFGVDLVVIPSRRSAGSSTIVAKTSAGSSVLVPMAVESNLVQAIEKLKREGFWIYGADMSGESLCRSTFSGRIALVMGSEGKGIRDLVKKQCDFIVSIPTTGKIDSLNISVAAGIFLYEMYRQRESCP